MVLHSGCSCDTACCNVLQCLAVSCSGDGVLVANKFQLSVPRFTCGWCCTVAAHVLQCVVVYYSVLQCVAVCCSVLQCVAVAMGYWLLINSSPVLLVLSC